MGKQLGCLIVVALFVLGPTGQSFTIVDELGFKGLDASMGPNDIVAGLGEALAELSDLDGQFTENLGQLDDPEIRFYCMGEPLSVAFGVSSVAYDYRPVGSPTGAMFSIDFEGSNAVEPVGVNPISKRSSYFYGKDPSNWVTGATSFREVLFPDLYDGIHLRYHMSEGKLKYDYVVEPFSDPSIIKMRFLGTEGLSIEPVSGDLVIMTAAGHLRDEAPIAFVEGPKQTMPVGCGYSLLDDETVGFKESAYDRSSTLVIDPGLNFSTYIGGTSDEVDQYMTLIQEDADGNIVLASSTLSDDFPITAGAYCTTYSQGDFDLVVLKLANDGKSLLFSTYIGGQDWELTLGVTIDDDGNILLSGRTASDDFPITKGSYQTELNGLEDGFFLKLDPSGSDLLFSTYLGGSQLDEYVYASKVDRNGDFYLVGRTDSNDFPVKAGCYDTSFNGLVDIFVAKMDKNASDVLLCTFIGGSSLDVGASLELDGDNIYVSGWTESNDLPATTGAYCETYQGGTRDGFLLQIDLNLTDLGFLTYIGGSQRESPFSDIRLDDLGNICVGGTTESNDFPVTKDAYDKTFNGVADGFVLKLNVSGDKLLFSTFFGGEDQDWLMAMDIDDSGSLFIYGDSLSTDLPLTDNAFDYTQNGEYDLYVGRLDKNGSVLEYCSYLGGSGDDNTGSRGLVRGVTNTTVAGETDSQDFPTTIGAFQRQSKGGIDIFVTRLATDLPSDALPSEPMNLSAEGRAKSIYLSWDEPLVKGDLRVREYNIYRGNTSLDLEFLATHVPTGSLGFLDTSLLNGKTYHYSVSAVNLNGEGAWCAVVNATPYGLPDPPPDFTATPGCSSILLTWNAPLDTGGYPIHGYRLHRGDSLFSIGHLRDLGNVTSFLDEGLKNGHLYYYKIQTLIERGAGVNSSAISARPEAAPTEPVTVTATPGDGQVELRWRPPLDDGGKQILGYHIHKGTTDVTLTMFITSIGSDTTFIDTEVVNGIVYYYSVLAYNEIGNGTMSEVASATPLGTPGAPVELDLSVGNGSVTLSWEMPLADGGTSILGFFVLRGLDAESMEGIGDLAADALTFIDNDLVNGQTYYYTVCAFNSQGNGTTAQILNAVPVGPPSSPVGLAIEAGDRFVNLTWSEPLDLGGSQVLEYIIYRGEDPSDMESFIRIGRTAMGFIDGDVTPGIQYCYSVAAVTIAGEGPRSSYLEAIPFGRPEPPTNLVITPSDGRVDLQWDEPTFDGASPITEYVIMRGTSTESLSELVRVNGTLSYTDTDVVNGWTYHYAVAAINEAGTSELTPSHEATPIEAATPPGMVGSLSAETLGKDVRLVWTEPLDDGGSPITGYLVYRGESSQTMEKIATLGPVLEFTDEDLSRGITYYYTILAVNEEGQGEPIDTFDVKVPKKKDEGPGFTMIVAVLAMGMLSMVAASRKR
jgi:fibronectin type 3 domain-containing protein